MKCSLLKFFFFPFIFLFTYSNFSFAQCIADAGNDRIICVGLYGMKDTIYIGGNPTVQGGIPPYNYTWSCDYWIGGGTLHFTASDFLDDTTVANPQIVNSTGGGGYDSVVFFLTIKDSIGTSCIDSIKVIFSSFVYNLQYYYFYIEEDDSVQFYGIPFIGGGLTPLIYTWYPPTGLNNANDLSAWASPDSTTCYSLTAIDAAGCKSDTFCFYEVHVYPLGIEKFVSNHAFNIYPNPSSKYLTINFDDANFFEGQLMIINSMGEILKSNIISESKTRINVETLPNGVYLIAFNKKDLLQQLTSIFIHH